MSRAQLSIWYRLHPLSHVPSVHHLTDCCHILPIAVIRLCSVVHKKMEQYDVCIECQVEDSCTTSKQFYLLWICLVLWICKAIVFMLELVLSFASTSVIGWLDNAGFCTFLQSLRSEQRMNLLCPLVMLIVISNLF